MGSRGVSIKLVTAISGIRFAKVSSPTVSLDVSTKPSKGMVLLPVMPFKQEAVYNDPQAVS